MAWSGHPFACQNSIHSWSTMELFTLSQKSRRLRKLQLFGLHPRRAGLELVRIGAIYHSIGPSSWPLFSLRRQKGRPARSQQEAAPPAPDQSQPAGHSTAANRLAISERPGVWEARTYLLGHSSSKESSLLFYQAQLGSARLKPDKDLLSSARLEN